MRGLWAVLGILIQGSVLLGVPDALEPLEPVLSSSTGSAGAGAGAVSLPKSSQAGGLVDREAIGGSIPLTGPSSPEGLGKTGVQASPAGLGKTGDVTTVQASSGQKGSSPFSGRGEQQPKEALSKGGDAVPLSINEPENRPLGLQEKTPERAEFQPVGKLTMLGILATFFGMAFLWVWYRKQIKGKIIPNARLPVQVLSQTWLDGQAKIITMRVGPKILVIAKSAQFCTTLDVISDPEEVNLITLGEGQATEDFQKVLKAARPNPQPVPRTQDIPDAEGIQAEIQELKRRLGTLKGDT